MNGKNAPKTSHNTQHEDDKAALDTRHILESTTFEARDARRRTKRATTPPRTSPAGSWGGPRRCLSSGVALGCCLSVYLYPRDLLTPRKNNRLRRKHVS